MSKQVKGPFETKRTVEPAIDLGDGVMGGHFRVDKVFAGALAGTGVVHMLSVGTATPGSAAYVAVERIRATLEGKSGSFCMQHNGTMNRGAATLDLTVVPDSGTDGLVGLAGRMAIDIADGKHTYTFDYALPNG